MPDISMCVNTTCWLRTACYRSPASGTEPDALRQSWMAFKPTVERVDGQIVQVCDHFWPTTTLDEGAF